jgi:hydrogenase expression/formation protein HypD
MLPPGVTMIHGPGCPVCVTSTELIDRAVAVAARGEVILASFGDMLRVPGSRDDLFTARSRGADVRVVYSPMDALELAAANPAREVVFFGVGFETTAPTTAMAVFEAARRGLDNFSVLVSHVLVPPAMEMLLSSPGCRVQGFLAAGHVCTVTGVDEYLPISARWHVPIVVCGFEPVDILEAVLACVRQLEQGRAEVENAYARVARMDGNPSARRVVETVYERVDRDWRGIGRIGSSGLALREEWRRFDAERRFPVHLEAAGPPRGACLSGEVLQGLKKPYECPSFGTACVPDDPVGAPMVSAEGACAAWYRYRGSAAR